MYLYVELWNARPAWLALSQEERAAYVNNLGPAIQGLLEAGVDMVGWGINDTDTPYRGAYRYLAVWKMQDRDGVQLLEQTVEQAGWHTYFEQINARGQLVTPDQVISDMLTLTE